MYQDIYILKKKEIFNIFFLNFNNIKTINFIYNDNFEY